MMNYLRRLFGLPRSFFVDVPPKSGTVVVDNTITVRTRRGDTTTEESHVGPDCDGVWVAAKHPHEAGVVRWTYTCKA